MTASFKVEHASRSSRIGTAAFAAAFVILAAAPVWGGRDDLRLLSDIYAYVALASLWNLLAGYAGLVSVGQQAYVGLGGYVLFASTILAGLHPLLAVPVAGAVAAALAVPVAGLMFRLRGHYFAIGTWVVAEVFRARRRLRNKPARGHCDGDGLDPATAGIPNVLGGAGAHGRGARHDRTLVAFALRAGAYRDPRQRVGGAIERRRRHAYEARGIHSDRLGDGNDRRVDFSAEAAHFARHRVQRQRLDCVCHL